jgi:hypothetical protein
MARLQTLEERHQYRTPAPEREAWFEVREGSVPVLVSAPHACMHDRDGVAKMEEEFTGAIAQYLSQSVSCHAIYSTYQAGEDPNWHTDSAYKRAIAKLHAEAGLSFVIDLHGMLNSHQMGVAVGTMQQQSCDATEIVLAFEKRGFVATDVAELSSSAADNHRRVNSDDSGGHAHRRLVVDHPRFTGGVRNHTVTRFVCEQLGVPSVQVELASVARVVHSPPTLDWPQSYTGDASIIADVVRALELLITKKSRGH